MTCPATTRTPATMPFDGLNIVAFEAGDVDPDAFSHAAHIFVAWSYLQETDLQQGIQRYSAALRRLTRKFGVPGKYHETVTWFFMMVIAERCQLDGSSDWQQFKSGNPDLFGDAKGLLSRYYTHDCLASPLARKQFLLPDRASPDYGAATI